MESSISDPINEYQRSESIQQSGERKEIPEHILVIELLKNVISLWLNEIKPSIMVSCHFGKR